MLLSPEHCASALPTHLVGEQAIVHEAGQALVCHRDAAGLA
jgi:hypothetical protein